VRGLVQSPVNSEMLICLGWDGRVCLMDTGTGKSVWEVRMSGWGDVAWSPDGRLVVVTAFGDNHLHVLDARDGRKLWKMPIPAWYMPFSVHGEEILYGAGNRLFRFDLATGKRIFPPPGAPLHWGVVRDVIPMPGTDSLLRICAAESIEVISAKTGKVEQSFPSKGRINGIAVSQNGQLGLAAESRRPVRVLDLRSGKIVRTLGHEGAGSVAFLKDSKRALTMDDARLCIWRLDDGMRIMNLESRQNNIITLAVSDDGILAAVTSWNKDGIRLYNLAEGKILGTIRQGSTDFRSCGFDPNSHSIVAVSLTGLHLFIPPRPKGGRLSEDEVEQLISQLGDDKYKVREEATRKLIEGGLPVLDAIQTLETDDPEVRHRLGLVRAEIPKTLGEYRTSAFCRLRLPFPRLLYFQPNGRQCVSTHGYYDTYTPLVIGELRDGRLRVLQTIEPEYKPVAARFAEDGTLYVGNYNGTISVYSRQ